MNLQFILYVSYPNSVTYSISIPPVQGIALDVIVSLVSSNIRKVLSLFLSVVILMFLKNTMSMKSLSCVRLCDPVDCSLPGSSIHGIFQARILEWVAILFSRGSSQPRD